MTPKSDTPRTDVEDVIWQRDYNNHRECDWPPITDVVSSDFARQLERELNAANERIKKLIEAGDLLESRTCRYGFKEWKEAKR